MKHADVAKRILQDIGKDNIQVAAHCATRLRLVLKDSKAINQKALDDDPDVKGTFETGGQFQIIIGPGDVDKVYDALIGITGLKEATTDDIKKIAATAGKPNPFTSFLKMLSDIFIPIVPALVAGGLLMALYNVLSSPGLFMSQSVVQAVPSLKGLADMVNTMASAPFTFLPILLGFSATKRFGGNQYLGATIGMIMVLPTLVNGYQVAAVTAAGKMTYWNIFGLHVAQAGYQGQVLPVLGVAFLLATIEKFLHKHLKGAVDFTFTPLLSIIVTGFLTFVVVGPVLRAVSDFLTNGLVGLYNATGWFGMAIFGVFYSAIVVTGLHQTFPAIETTLIAAKATTGGSFIFPVASMANIAQGGAAAAVFFASKDSKQRALASSSSISALLGITEPAIFGVNLKLRFPFYCAAIASGIASAILGLFHVLAWAMGSAGVLGFISIAPKSIVAFLLAAVISLVTSFVMTFIVAKRVLKNEPEEAPVDPTTGEETQADTVIAAPVAGTIEPITQVNDKVFSAEIMGKGIAIKPASDEVHSPVTGTVTVAYPTHHAYGIKADDGAEVLIHLGIDTVDLKGQYFTSKVGQGDHVNTGDLLGTFDYQAIANAGYDTTVMIVITNTNAYASVEPVTTPTVKPGDHLVALTARSSDNAVATDL